MDRENVPNLVTARSCLVCKQRKVKCDRQQPCNNCALRSQDCTFPHGRIRRRRAGGQRRGVEQPNIYNDASQSHDQVEKQMSSTKPATDNGYLIVGEAGQSRLLAHSAWANVKDEVKNQLPASPSPSVAIYGVQTDVFEIARPLSADALICKPISPWLTTLHQDQQDVVQLCWHIYVENVDPVVRILHKPTLHKQVLRVQQQSFDQVDKPTQALLFAVCLCAISSLEPKRCEILFEQPRVLMKQLCQKSVDNAIAAAGLTRTHNFQVLQAFTLSIVCMRADGSRFIWTLIGLAIRIATSLGLHCDGTDFGLTPLETEMRRRLWWELRVLEIRASEDCGALGGLFVSESTHFPLNVNDTDLNPAAKCLPEEHHGVTEMSFCLYKYELCAMLGSLSSNRPDNHHQAKKSNCYGETAAAISLQIEKKNKLIADLGDLICRKHVDTFNANKLSPICRLGAETWPIMLTKIKLRNYFEVMSKSKSVLQDSEVGVDATCNKESGNHSIPEPVLKDLFYLSVNLLESYNRLLADSEFSRWQWLFVNYTPWHAISFVLSQMSFRIEALTEDMDVVPSVAFFRLPDVLQRAWKAVEVLFREHNQENGCYTNNGSGIWEPLEAMRRLVQSRLLLSDSAANEVAEQDDSQIIQAVPNQGLEWTDDYSILSYGQEPFAELDALLFQGQ
ncbi:Bikaverin cluster transcription factor bik5-like protein [Cladobotryum mycophilum]|uniref:Bikaverin cluster transcription factor bik5-like protein n=1 Tax=Cladobotryum mycophilum TaxID=491253 RepID=A0ABR0SZW3_9HYPO